jgi:hypothetical protein
MRQVIVRGLKNVAQMFLLNIAAYNLVSILRWDRSPYRAPDEFTTGSEQSLCDSERAAKARS